MKHKIKVLAATVLAGILFAGSVFAGNLDRSGQAGASELLINPWARSSGWADANIAGCRGLESQFLNVAGTAFTKKTELLFDHTNYLGGTGIGINTFGFSQKAGASGVLGLGIMSMDFGNIPVTTTELPEGGLGNFKIQMLNIGLSYAKGFTDHIFGGMNFKVINEAIPNARAAGVALDAGIQYLSGPMNNIHFGLSLKNVGPKMQYSGDGLAFKTLIENGTVGGSNMTVNQRSAAFEMPSQLHIGGSYDYYLGDTAKTHRITLASVFTSNSFGKDQVKVGLEYGFKSFLMVRAGYAFEKGITNNDDTKDIFRTNAFTGFSTGFTAELPLNKEKGSTFGLDYSYRATNPFNGTHTIGVRMNL
ncbi:MAG: PorV/PorQ family protein [Bacteroidetes bacterium]|nr:PorV/PorQ family protein [Bacteroidota bacterium]